MKRGLDQKLLIHEDPGSGVILCRRTGLDQPPLPLPHCHFESSKLDVNSVAYGVGRLGHTPPKRDRKSVDRPRVLLPRLWWGKCGFLVRISIKTRRNVE